MGNDLIMNVFIWPQMILSIFWLEQNFVWSRDIDKHINYLVVLNGPSRNEGGVASPANK